MVVGELEKALKKITVRGVVQGVGFRPFVFNLAERLGLGGWVLNNSGGVEIEVEGPPDALDAFVTALRDEAPPLAYIESLQAQEAPPQGYDHFEIRHSERQEGRYQLISPDIATCPDCLHELFDPADRRYRYPFTNCTNCGPRFTIIADIPYDRPNTTMRVFPMCPVCQREYDDPRNRRFHAQPNACPVCGPQLELVPSSGFKVKSSAASPWNLNPETAPDVIAQAADLLRRGAILAVKGLGGFHLACDATNAGAVRTLRERKRRPHKPFAVMMATLDEIRQHCQVSPEEEALLTSPQCPIVLLSWRSTSTVVPEVAPAYRYLGVMLPYTPLHHVLLRDVGRPLVMTSGNLSEEPIAADNDEARRRLGHMADVFLMHNRDIYARYDDSVWFVPYISRFTSHAPQPIRRSRGYAPFPIKLPFKMQQILACGAEIKNTFCLTRDEYAFVSQHIGDMENLETLGHFERTIGLYKHLFRIEPQIVAHDLHPDYLATRYALEKLATCNLQPVTVQHHHAHIAACLADSGWGADDGPVIGVALDGTGYGQDGHIWGGEWLVGDYHGYRRAAHLEYLPLPGGDAATRNPWRIAVSYLYTLLGEFPQLPFLDGVDAAELDLLRQQLDRRLNCPLTSSMGRLFDAVSALLGVCGRTSYEAQAAIELEMVASGQVGESAKSEGYPFRIEVIGDHMAVRLRELFAALVADLQAEVPVAEMAWRFHRTIARMTVEVCERIAADTGLRTVALSGGCYQNRLLLSLTVPLLEAASFRVLLHHQVPCNDGGLSLGQAVIAHFASQ
ncbi:MAG TPA: carbamoyltransferase HypF [Anaerolineae bacterium]|nr:carbamoyltransferase HypF [Anaerolineae bacterium]